MRPVTSSNKFLISRPGISQATEPAFLDVTFKRSAASFHVVFFILNWAAWKALTHAGSIGLHQGLHIWRSKLRHLQSAPPVLGPNTRTHISMPMNLAALRGQTACICNSARWLCHHSCPSPVSSETVHKPHLDLPPGCLMHGRLPRELFKPFPKGPKYLTIGYLGFPYYES